MTTPDPWDINDIDECVAGCVKDLRVNELLERETAEDIVGRWLQRYANIIEAHYAWREKRGNEN